MQAPFMRDASRAFCANTLMRVRAMGCRTQARSAALRAARRVPLRAVLRCAAVVTFPPRLAPRLPSHFRRF